jgi:hypothetical protein
MKHNMKKLLLIIQVIILVGCKQDEAIPDPVISSFSPAEGIEGTVITVNGQNFSEQKSENKVIVWHTPLEVLSATSTEIKAKVPAGSESGPITLNVNGKTTTTDSYFYSLSIPAIQTVTPLSGKAGDEIVIKGTGFSNELSGNTVKIDGVISQITKATNTQLNVIVPAEATMGVFTITSPGGTFTSSIIFQLKITVGTFSPTSGPLGTRIKITGTGFSVFTTVPTFNSLNGGGLSGTLVSVTPTELVVIPPEEAISGPIKFINTSLQTTNAFTVTGSDPVYKKSFPGTLRRGAIGFSINNFLFVGLGSSQVGQKLTDFWKYNSIDDTWSRIADFPGVGRFGATTFVVNGRGYVYGSGLLNELWEYDPPADSWIQKNDFPGAARSNATAFAINGIVYMGMGSPDKKDFWAYNPANDSWIRKADFPGEASAGAGSFVIGQTGYVTGGWTSPDNTAHLFVYNPATNTWNQESLLLSFSTAGFDRCIGFSINGTGYIASQGNIYQYIPNVPYGDKTRGKWIRVQSVAGEVVPTGPNSGSYYDYNAGYCLANDKYAFGWFGSDKFWLFNAPN